MAAWDARAFSLLLGIPGVACSVVFIGENAHRSRVPALHPRGRCSRANSLMVRSGDFLRVLFFLRKNGHESIDSLYTLREFALVAAAFFHFDVEALDLLVQGGQRNLEVLRRLGLV